MQAETALKQARSIYTELFGAESVQMAHWWNETGFLRRLQGRKWNELDAYERAYEIIKSFPEADQAVLATRALNFGSPALELGKAEQALGALQEAYDLAANVYAELPTRGFFVATQSWLAVCLLVLDRKGVAGMRAKAADMCAA